MFARGVRPPQAAGRLEDASGPRGVPDRRAGVIQAPDEKPMPGR
jgi:hypothetical protein